MDQHTSHTLIWAGAVVGAVAVQYAYTLMIERHTEKRMRIKFEIELDLIAIRKARDLVLLRNDYGFYSTYIEAMSDLNQEIELQKIAIREG